MERVHIMLNEDLLEEIIIYARKYNNNNLSEAIRDLATIGLSNKSNEIESKRLNQLSSSIGYLKKLTESMYKDLSPASFDAFNLKMKGNSFDD